MLQTIPRRVTAPDGIGLAAYETGDPAAPTVVAVHGYPDNHTVWDGVVEQLAGRFHVVTYDVRGAGESDKPAARSAYRMTHLIDDLRAVLDAVSPAAPVHLVGHDWGSIQAWSAVTDERLAGRIASYTSISGPDLDYTGAWMRAGAKHPGAALRQLADSYYIGLFQLPGLPEAAARRGAFDRLAAAGARRGRSALAQDVPLERGIADQVNGIQLYRANMPAHLGRPHPVPTDLPVLAVAPDRDPYVSVALQLDSPAPWVANLTTRTVAGGHWVVAERPDVIARLVSEHIGGTTSESVAGRTSPAGRGRFAGKLVLVTGGARGIGRSTALAFAREGAALVLADVDDVAVKETLAEVREFGVQAWAEHLDVSDPAAWEAFAEAVKAARGVPDVVVNNAGIGMGGPFLKTTRADWEKIVGINVWGVIDGCRVFAAQQVERGEGGHIVNIASAAAFSPSVIYPAYATTKAAVLMLSECLRAELSRESIGVTAVCPGFINTDISRTTIHVGVDEQTAQDLSERQVAAYQRRGYSPDKVAQQVVAAVAANKPLAIITPEAKALRALSRFAPNLGRRLSKVDLTRLG